MNYQEFVNQFCIDKELPRCKVRLSNLISDINYGIYYLNSFTLYKDGQDVDTMIHELAHHYQVHKLKPDSDHGSSFHGSLKVIRNYMRIS